MSSWIAYDSYKERNADTAARVKGQQIYVAETKPGSGLAARQIWDGTSWKTLGDTIPAVSASTIADTGPAVPEPTPTPTPEPPPPKPKPDFYKNPWNKMSAYHRPMGSGAVCKISASTENPKADHPTYSGGGPILTKSSPNPLANVGRLTCKSGPQGIKYWYRGDGPDKTMRIESGGSITEPTPRGMPVPADRGDSNFLLLRDDGVTCSLYFNYYSGMGTAKRHILYRLDGLDTDNDGQPGGTSASHVRWPMALDADELRSGTISHCLNLTATRHSNAGASDNAHILGKGMCWPAYARDGSAGEAGNNKGKLPYGQKVGIAKFHYADVDALKLNPIGRTLVKNLKEFAWYVLDGSGQNAGSPDKGVLQIRCNQTVMPDSPLADEIDTQLALLLPFIRPLSDDRIYKEQAAVVANPCTGGGIPLGINTAYDM